MSQMVSRRQPIYRLACMVDVTSSVSVVHQSPATQHSLTSSSQHSTYPDSLCLLLCGCLPPHAHFLSCLVLLSLDCFRAADVQPSGWIKWPPAGFSLGMLFNQNLKEIPFRKKNIKSEVYIIENKYFSAFLWCQLRSHFYDPMPTSTQCIVW